MLSWRVVIDGWHPSDDPKVEARVRAAVEEAIKGLIDNDISDARLVEWTAKWPLPAGHGMPP